MASSVTEPEHAHPTPTTKTAATTAWGLFWGASVVAAVLLLVGALAWLIIGYGTGNFVDADAKRVVERQKILADRNAEDYKLLHDPASFLARDKGIVRVPIDRAIALALPELQAAQPHPAYPLKDSPPQPANAPTSPDKGAEAAANSATNPAASNPTVAQPSPAPVAATPTPAPATSASNAPAAPTPAATVAPTPAPAATAVPAATPAAPAAPSPDNNANNPGNPPVPGTAVQTAAPAPAPAPTAAAATGAQPEPLTAPPSQPTPTGTAPPSAAVDTTPTPAPTAPGASPAGTP